MRIWQNQYGEILSELREWRVYSKDYSKGANHSKSQPFLDQYQNHSCFLRNRKPNIFGLIVIFEDRRKIKSA